jgi:multicomponent Na+:H+ antiporter subunit C
LIYDIILALAIIGIALFGICVSDNIIKSIICFNIVQAAVILLFILLAGYSGSSVPIVSELIGEMVDPLPQALMITAIVISASITALALMFSVKIFHFYGTLSWKELGAKDVKNE